MWAVLFSRYISADLKTENHSFNYNCMSLVNVFSDALVQVNQQKRFNDDILGGFSNEWRTGHMLHVWNAHVQRDV